jgi:hypothetical protein
MAEVKSGRNRETSQPRGSTLREIKHDGYRLMAQRHATAANEAVLSKT